MNLDWTQINPQLLTANTSDGGHVELTLDDRDDSWHVFSTLPELNGIGYMGGDRHGAIHITTCLLAPARNITSWTIHGKGKVQVIWDLDDDTDIPDSRSRLAKLLRRAEPE